MHTIKIYKTREEIRLISHGTLICSSFHVPLCRTMEHDLPLTSGRLLHIN